MYKFLFFYFALFFIAFGAAAARVKKAPSPKKVVPEKVYHLQFDSSKLTLHKFNADSLNKYRDAADFNYSEKAGKKAGLSWWHRFWKWFWETLARLFGGQRSSSSGSSFPFMAYLIGFGLLALLIFVIFKMAGLNLENIFYRRSREISIPYAESMENIHQITFDEEIEKALNQRNYRLAVRLLYLKSLKQLNDADLINWQIGKTNAAYLTELTDTELRRSFSILTRQFEYIWYGDFPVDGNSFRNINTLFHDFKISPK